MQCFFENTFFYSFKFNLVLWHNHFFVHFLASRFYKSYSTFRRSFKEKCPLNGAKTRVQHVNPGTFLLHWYRYVLLCFYYVASGTYCGGSEFKYLRTVAKNVCSIVLEICPTLNPTLNLPDCVDKCKTVIAWYYCNCKFVWKGIKCVSQSFTASSVHFFWKLQWYVFRVSLVHLCHETR